MPRARSHILPFSTRRQAEKALRAELRKAHKEALAHAEVEATEASESNLRLVRQSSEATLKESLMAKEATLAATLAALHAEKEAAEKALGLREEAHAKASISHALRHFLNVSTATVWCCWQKQASTRTFIRTTLKMICLRTAARAKVARHAAPCRPASTASAGK